MVLREALGRGGRGTGLFGPPYLSSRTHSVFFLFFLPPRRGFLLFWTVIKQYTMRWLLRCKTYLVLTSSSRQGYVMADEDINFLSRLSSLGVIDMYSFNFRC